MIKIEKTNSENLIIARQCENIATQNLIEHGGELQFSKTVYECDEIFYIMLNEEVIGFAAIKYGYRLKDDAYIMQIAMQKEYQHQGYGTMLYNYIKQFVHVNYLTCDIKEKNKNSIKFHKKNGFYPQKYVNLIIYEHKLN